MRADKPKLLLHICCAPDASVVFERLKPEYEITGYFYNPNIHPQEEYELRANETKRLAEIMHIPLAKAPNDTDRWFGLVKGMEHLPEKGERCTVCIRMRMEQAARFCAENGFDMFTTVLTVSPHKNADLINSIGDEMAAKFDVKYMEANFKKKDGFKRSLELCRKYNIYRQNYCGCVYSKPAGEK